MKGQGPSAPPPSVTPCPPDRGVGHKELWLSTAPTRQAELCERGWSVEPVRRVHRHTWLEAGYARRPRMISRPSACFPDAEMQPRSERGALTSYRRSEIFLSGPAGAPSLSEAGRRGRQS